MIEKLPLEVLEILYSYFDAADLTACQCVSQGWYRRWMQLVYRKIHTFGEKQLEKLLNHAIPWSIRGQQVRKLVIEKGHVQPEILGKLPTLFPFVESFMFDGVVLCEAARKKTLHYYQQRKQQEEMIKIKHCFKTWAQHLRQIVEFNGIMVTHCILTDNCCPHLTRLSLQFNNTNDQTNCKMSLFASLKNAPFLTHFSLQLIFIHVKELELIHHDCQRLKSLRLKSVIFLPMATGYMDREVVPAPDFRTLECIDSSFAENADDWLQYIAAKYSYAETLDIGSCTLGNSTDGANRYNERYNDSLLALASKCTRLKSLNISSFPLSEAFLHELGKQSTCLKQVTIGDEFEFNLRDDMKALMHSRQKNCISNLIIRTGSSSGGFGFILKSINSCPFLTSLVLHMTSTQQQHHGKLITSTNHNDSEILFLHQVITVCPHLINLKVMGAKLQQSHLSPGAFNELISNTTAKNISKLRSLIVENSRFDDSLFTTVSSLCPQLNSLSLTCCIYNSFNMQHGQAKIYLPNHSLDTCILDSIRVSRHCSVRLGTSRFSINTQFGAVCYDLMEYEWRRIGSWEGSNNREQLCAKKAKVIMGGIEKKAYLSLVCKNIKQLHLTGLEVMKDGYFLF